ncbi:MAG TPA: M1 family metallopeptidase [Flavobacteriales bacterium]
MRTAHVLLFLALAGGVMAGGSDRNARRTRSTGGISRSDSLDLLHTRIDLDLTQTAAGIIRARASIRFVPKVEGITVLPLDLLQLTVDSVRSEGLPLAFTQVGELVSVSWEAALGAEDTVEVELFYHGDPVTDPSGFGGFYTTPNYQYDLGVAFDAIPHSFGRSWFPCFDNFVERCSFEYFVHTTGDRKVTANGTLMGVEELGGGERITHWAMDEPIPAYLASVAAGNYATIHDSFPSIAGIDIPVTLSGLPGDTADLRASFLHLRNAFDTYERWFGPYRWDRVGYTLTSAGAMEHATNICYPDFAADGSLADERLMAHELSHHWFGNLITCARAEEMWINEGMADLCGYLFIEDLYGRQAYLDLVNTVHRNMVARVHLLDGASHALSEVPQEITYGEHSYKKGADIGHTLRGYLGDSLFSVGFKRVLANNAYSDMGSIELRDSLIASTGVDLTAFFDDWVLQPGWAAFEVDSIVAQPQGGAWQVTAYVEQKLRFAEHFYTQVPVAVTFEGASGDRWELPAPLMLGGAQSTITAEVPFLPVRAFLNNDTRLALATTFADDTVTTTGTRSFTRADLVLITTAIDAPMPIRLEEFWTAADGAADDALPVVPSPDRWWRITGDFPESYSARLRFTLDGRTTGVNAYDRQLVQEVGGAGFREDSLRILYRPDARFDWTILPDVTLTTLGSITDGSARLEVGDIAPGDYAFGLARTSVGMEGAAAIEGKWTLLPNPAQDVLHVQSPRAGVVPGSELVLRDVQGRILWKQKQQGRRTSIDVARFAGGTIIVSAVVPGAGEIGLGRVVVLDR